MRFPGRFFAGCLLLTFLAGCVARPLDRRLKQSSEAREEEFRGLLDSVESEPQQRISWGDARRRMQRENLGLQQSRKMLEDAERLTQRQWLTLVPRTSAFLNLSQSLGALSNFESDDLYASVVASFNIPSPFEFYATLYGAALQQQNARWSNELDERRAFVELYSAFQEAATLREEEAALDQRRRAMELEKSTDIIKTLNSTYREINNMKRRRLTHRGNVNRLLNTPGGNWDLAGDPPAISYRTRHRTVKIGNDFGKLALNLYAIQIESAILQTQRVKFKQWPAINFGLSNPPLYTTSGDNEITGEDFTMFSGASKSLDLTDIAGRESIREAKFRLKITREQLRLSMEREAARQVQIREAYDQLLTEERGVEARLSRFNRPATSQVEAVLADLELRSQLEMQLIQIRRQIKQLDLQYLTWDESFWKS